MHCQQYIYNSALDSYFQLSINLFPPLQKQLLNKCDMNWICPSRKPQIMIHVLFADKGSLIYRHLRTYEIQPSTRARQLFMLFFCKQDKSSKFLAGKLFA